MIRVPAYFTLPWLSLCGNSWSFPAAAAAAAAALSLFQSLVWYTSIFPGLASSFAAARFSSKKLVCQTAFYINSHSFFLVDCPVIRTAIYRLCWRILPVSLPSTNGYCTAAVDSVASHFCINLSRGVTVIWNWCIWGMHMGDALHMGSSKMENTTVDTKHLTTPWLHATATFCSTAAWYSESTWSEKPDDWRPYLVQNY